MSGPLVSIVTPTLDQGGLIEETLRSVHEQTYAAIEHIVIDGGSTDGTLEILARYEQPGRLTWTSGPDAGMYDALNSGLARSRGEILAYLNSDDLLLPWAVEAVIEALAQHSDADVVYGDALCLGPANRLDLKLQVPFRQSRLSRFGSLVQPSVFWRRRVIDRIGWFDASLDFVGDLDYWLRAGDVMPVIHLDEVLSIYRVHPGAKTTRSRGPMREEEQRMRARHHRDGRWATARKLEARASHELAVRAQLLRFAQATQRAGDPRWARFRQAMAPRIRPVRFLLALMPLVGRVVHPPWLQMSSLPARLDPSD